MVKNRVCAVRGGAQAGPRRALANEGRGGVGPWDAPWPCCSPLPAAATPSRASASVWGLGMPRIGPGSPSRAATGAPPPPSSLLLLHPGRSGAAKSASRSARDDAAAALQSAARRAPAPASAKPSP